MKPRHLVLGALLVAASAAAFWPSAEAPVEVVEPVQRAARPSGAVALTQIEAAPATASPMRSHPPLAAEPAADLFPSQSFRPPPPPMEEQAEPPPPPMAPPLPFGYLGAWTENGRLTVFLAQGGQTLCAEKGERLPGGWRIDDATPESVLFTYEPLNQQKTLRIAP